MIALENVTKTYRIGIGRARVREMLPSPLDRLIGRAFPRWWSRDSFDALRDVSLTIPRGTSLGVIGHNGAGKTTLLRVVAGVTVATRGRVAVSGRVAALIDILVGFHPDLTGRENAYVYAALHGLGRRSMASRIERVFDFAEITEYADTPLKRYSAGMSARLGFAIITALDAEVLLVDEVLAVGDADFQRKCVTWLDSYRSAGGTLVFVSHNLALVRSMTERIVWLDHGAVKDDGRTADVLARYATATERRQDAAPALQGDIEKLMQSRGLHRWGAGGARLEKAQVWQPEESGALEVAITYDADGLSEALFCIGFLDESGREVGGAASPLIKVIGGRGAVQCSIRPLPLRSGVYFPVVGIISSDGVVRDRWRLDRAVVVPGSDAGLAETVGPVEIPAAWSEARDPS